MSDDDFARAKFQTALLATLIERLVPPLLPEDETLLAQGVHAYVRDEWGNLAPFLRHPTVPDTALGHRWTSARLASEVAWETWLLLSDLEPDHGLLWDSDREPACPCGCSTVHLEADAASGDSGVLEYCRAMLDGVPF